MKIWSSRGVGREGTRARKPIDFNRLHKKKARLAYARVTPGLRQGYARVTLGLLEGHIRVTPEDGGGAGGRAGARNRGPRRGRGQRRPGSGGGGAPEPGVRGRAGAGSSRRQDQCHVTP